MDDEHVMIPRVVGVNMGISFFDEDQDPVIVFNAVMPADALQMQLVHPGTDGTAVVPLAFTPGDLQGLLPEINEAVIRARTLIEMFTILPEQRDLLMKNIAFRWTGQMVEDDGDGEPQA